MSTTVAPTPLFPELRTPGVELVLDAVRSTGRSAHPEEGDGVSLLVFAVATTHGYNPVRLQREVETYADALDTYADASAL